jgi:hypothetical protein
MAIEAFCLLLRRLSYPNHWFDLEDNFGFNEQNFSLHVEFFAAAT